MAVKRPEDEHRANEKQQSADRERDARTTHASKIASASSSDHSIVIRASANTGAGKRDYPLVIDSQPQFHTPSDWGHGDDAAVAVATELE